MIAIVHCTDAIYEVATGFDRRRWVPADMGHRFDLYAIVAEQRGREAIRRVVDDFEDRRRRSGASDRDIADAFARLVEAGDVQVIRVAGRPLATTHARGDAVEPDEPAPLLELAAKHFVEFRFVDSKGNAVGGIPYVFTGASGEQESGTLARDGRIRRDHVEDGTYGVELQTVVSAQWCTPATPCDAEAELRAEVTGCSDGTKVTVRIFREFAETDDDVIDTFEAEVLGNEVVTPWKYDYTGDDERSAAQGDVAFVAEVSLSSGSWAKTIAPLTVTLKTIELADWSHEECAPKTEVELFADVAALSDAADVMFSIYRVTPQGNGELVVEQPATSVSPQRLAVQWTAPDRTGEFYFEVTVDDTVVRRAVSDLLCVQTERPSRR